jgi:hypothetical protein
LPASNDNSFATRLSTAATAKQALLEKFKTRPAEDDPAEMERRAERARVIEARDARIAEKEARRKAEDDRKATLRKQQDDARLAAERAIADEKAAREEAKSALIKRVVADEATLKAARDARYASRKTRVGRG